MTGTDCDLGIELPGYTILREIGRGGVSTVYLARHELLGRQVAIKVMSPVLAVEQGFNKRFIREGQTVARLEHPGIVAVYDVAVVEHRPFIAMEYLPGGSLKDRIQAPVPPQAAISYLRTVAGALGYAHGRGIYHRDVKPENILFRSSGEAVLTDFGIAKSESQETALTSVGVVVGTPRYISPEQAQGDGGDARSDIYALGVIFHEMLTGRPPYDVKGSMSLLYAHINEPVPRLPGDLADYQALLDDMLAKEPENRISNCALLAERLDAPRTVSWRRRAGFARRTAGGRGVSRRPGWAVAALGVTLGPVLALTLWMQGYLPGVDGGSASGAEFRQAVARLVTGNTDSPERTRERLLRDRRLAASAGGSPVPAPPETVPASPGDPSGGASGDAVRDRGLDAQSLHNQARALLWGRVAEENLVAAAELHTQAAEKGHAQSQYYLGVAYANGDGVERDDHRALHWLQRAAGSGARGAQYNLVLARVFGPEPDAAAAARAALGLAKQQYAPVYRILGWMYNSGIGVDSSFTQSVRWNVRTMVGDVTGKADAPRWVVRRWERQLQAELDRIRESNPPTVKPVVR